MDWNRTTRIGDGDDGRSRAVDDGAAGSWIPLASRRSGFARVRAGVVGAPLGPILITGEAGAGKTWLWSQAVRSLPPHWRCVAVDATSGLGAAELLLLIGDAMGRAAAVRAAVGSGFGRGVGAARLELAAAIRDDAEDGRSWVLVLDDAHTASPELWEEIRVLSNRIGRADGFGAIILAAQTDLIRRLAERPYSSVAGRIADQIHLPPLDADECQALARHFTGSELTERTARAVEEIQRDARGNCGRILRLLRARLSLKAHCSTEPLMRNEDQDELSRSESAPSPELNSRQAPRTAARPTAGLLPSRPPLRLEEGLIEVGWQGEIAAPPEPVEPAAADPHPLPASRPPTAPDDSRRNEIEAVDAVEETAAADLSAAEPEPAVEWIDDPYTTLQAWTEWARNRERIAERTAAGAEPVGARDLAGGDAESDPDEAEAAADSQVEPSQGASLRAEGSHEFSPYGRLFGDHRTRTHS